MADEWITLDSAYVFVSALNGTKTHIQQINLNETLCGVGWLQEEERDVSRRPLQREHLCPVCLNRYEQILVLFNQPLRTIPNPDKEERQISEARANSERRAKALGEYTPVEQILSLSAEVERLRKENERQAALIAAMGPIVQAVANAFDLDAARDHLDPRYRLTPNIFAHDEWRDKARAMLAKES